MRMFDYYDRVDPDVDIDIDENEEPGDDDFPEDDELERIESRHRHE